MTDRANVQDGTTTAAQPCLHCGSLLPAGLPIYLDTLGGHIWCASCESSFDEPEYAEKKARLIATILDSADECDVKDWAAMWLNCRLMGDIEAEADKSKENLRQFMEAYNRWPEGRK